MTGITLYPGIRFQTKFSNMHYIPRFPRNSYGKSTIKEYTADRRWAQRLLIFNEIVSMGKIVPANFPTFITLFSYSKRVSPGAKSMSRTQSRKKYARSRTASVWASLRPMHARGPVPNIGRSNSDTPSHLDGLNWPGFSKVFGFRPNWNVCWERLWKKRGRWLTSIDQINDDVTALWKYNYARGRSNDLDREVLSQGARDEKRTSLKCSVVQGLITPQNIPNRRLASWKQACT